MKKQSTLIALLLLLLLTLCACETHTHDYEVTSEKAASCTGQGYITYRCKECGNTYQETLPTAGHSLEEATCKQPKTCKVCGETFGGALNHSIDPLTGKCSYCGEAIITLAKGLPATYAYTWGYGTYTELKITSVSFTWFSDELTVHVTGEKTYDWKGDYGTTTPYFLVILRDASGKVLATEKWYSWDDIIVGQTFHGKITFPGVTQGEKYTIELADYEI